MRGTHRRVLTSIDELIDPFTEANASPVLLRPSRVRVEHARLDLRDVSVEVVDFSCPIAVHGKSEAGRVSCFAVVRQSEQGHLNGQPTMPGIFYVCGESTEMTAATAGTSRYAVLTFGVDALEAARAMLEFDVQLAEPGEFRLARAASWPRLRRFLQLVPPTVRAMTGRMSAEHAAVLRNDLLGIAVRSLAAEHDRSIPLPNARCNAVRIVRLCERHAARARYQGVTLADLATASGVSERSVRNAFAECYGMSPTAFLRVAALNKVRRALLQAPPRSDVVSRTATDFGFWHLSRFASHYRALFGETPSNTFAQSAHVAAR